MSSEKITQTIREHGPKVIGATAVVAALFAGRKVAGDVYQAVKEKQAEKATQA